MAARFLHRILGSMCSSGFSFLRFGGIVVIKILTVTSLLRTSNPASVIVQVRVAEEVISVTIDMSAGNAYVQLAHVF
jgi:hypothetical protein